MKNTLRLFWFKLPKLKWRIFCVCSYLSFRAPNPLLYGCIFSSKWNSYRSLWRFLGEIQSFFQSSSSTFHDFTILPFYEIKKSQFEIQKIETTVSEISEILKIINSQIWKIICPKDLPRCFLAFFEVNSWQIRGSRIHYGSNKCLNFRSSKIHLKSSAIDKESIINYLWII